MTTAIEGARNVFTLPDGIVVRLTCPRCWGPMFRTNNRGRRPKSCETCRTPAEQRHVAYMRRHNEKVRAAKLATPSPAS